MFKVGDVIKVKHDAEASWLDGNTALRGGTYTVRGTDSYGDISYVKLAEVAWWIDTRAVEVSKEEKILAKLAVMETRFKNRKGC